MKIVKKYWIGLLAALLLVGAGVLIYRTLHPGTLPENLVEGTGRIDGDLINLNTKYPGRVKSIAVDDGVPVKKGMVVALLSSQEQQAQKAQIDAQIQAQKKMLDAKEIEAQIANRTIPLALQKAHAGLSSAKAQMQALQKQISVQKALAAQSERDYRRMQGLYNAKNIAKHDLELSRLKWHAEHDKLEALYAQQKQVKAAIAVADTALREAQASQQKLQAIQANIDGLKESIEALKASRTQIEAVLSQMTLTSPIDGYTVDKIANAGEVIGAGMPVATLLDPHSLYLKIFVDTIKNGKIKLGDKAVIFLDAYPNRPIAASVVRIAQKAEFTPKEVSVRSDRIQRVYAVHLKPRKPDPLLKLGIPAIGVISTDGKGLPKSMDEIPVL